MKRRKFNKTLGALGLLPLPIFLNRCTVSSYNDTELSAAKMNDHVVVLIQLKGGNDGLNSLIPKNQYDLYANLRPTIRIKEEDMIDLDSTLEENQTLGLHPALLPLKTLYEEGLLSIIQSVSYPFVNRSHFKSTDLWLTGGDGTPQQSNLKSGWIGSYLSKRYPDKLGSTNDFPDPLGIQLGNPNSSLGFHIDGDHNCSVNIAGQDPSGYFTNISDAGGLSPSSFPPTAFGEAMQFIADVQVSTNEYAERISAVFDKGKNQHTYPDTHLSNQLKTVARLLSGGSKTKFFLVQLDDFDTHKDQIVDGDSLNGEHAVLLREFAEAALAFQRDLKNLGLDKQVLTMTFSEFGRKAKENGDLGTDHGNIAPMFVMGSTLPGVYGKNDPLDLIDENGLLTEMQFDYREVYTHVLKNWLGASDSLIQELSYGQFLSNKTSFI